jgi:hypothetical protein
VYQLFIDFKKGYNSLRRQVLYNIFPEFGIPTKLLKMCLNETCSRVQVGKDLFDMFCIKNGSTKGEALSPLLFNFALKYAIRRVHANQESLQLNGTHQVTHLYSKEQQKCEIIIHIRLWFMPIILIQWVKAYIL